MNYPTFEETSLAGAGLNRARRNWNRKLLVTMYRNGNHTGRWQRYSYADLADEFHRLACAWQRIGVKPQEKVAVLGKNRPRWIQSAMSLIVNNIILVPIYPTLVARDVAYILNDAGARYVVVDTPGQAAKILSVIDQLPDLKEIFVMDPTDDSPEDNVYSYDSLLKRVGRKVDLEPIYERVRRIGGEDLAAIIYTSGTTGRPKGVMLTNDNLLSQQAVLPQFKLNEEDVFLNHLPFCHAFGLTADLLGSASVGATLAIADGITPEQIRHALTTIRPTVLMSVPRLFEKMHMEVYRVVGTQPKAVQKIFEEALAVGKGVFDRRNAGKRVPVGLAVKFKLAERVLKKVKHQAGMDRVRVAYAGGGPVSKDLCYFFQSLGIDIFQGYGLTESSPICTVNVPGKNKLGTVGPAIKGVEVKIGADGEILTRGRNMMKGYYNLPDATAEVIDPDGWFHTGDVGTMDDDGYLTITDRIKELIITSGGKNIAPLSIETAFNMEGLIEQLVVIGDNRKYLTALVCPNFEALHAWAKAQGLTWENDAELVRDRRVVRRYEGITSEVNRQLARFEQIKKVAVMDHEFSEETGELTPTQKVKRRVVDAMYKDVIDAMY